MKSINYAEFKKRVYKKGRFKQYIVAPYASEERSGNRHVRVVLTSGQVKDPTWLSHGRRKEALILPDGIDTFTDHFALVQTWTGVQAPYFGAFDLVTDSLVFTFREVERFFEIHYNDGVFYGTVTFTGKTDSFIERWIRMEIESSSENCNADYHLTRANFQEVGDV